VTQQVKPLTIVAGFGERLETDSIAGLSDISRTLNLGLEYEMSVLQQGAALAAPAAQLYSGEPTMMLAGAGSFARMPKGMLLIDPPLSW